VNVMPQEEERDEYVEMMAELDPWEYMDDLN
jgi:hypothetical protein